eukprot:9198402-Alexandrium_andersonii.AAC.1
MRQMQAVVQPTRHTAFWRGMLYLLRQTPAEALAVPGTQSVGVQAPSIDALPSRDGHDGAATSTAGLAAAGDARSSTSGDTMHTAAGS